MRLRFALLLLGILPLSLYAEEGRPNVEVTGTAIRKIANDVATIQIGIENKAATRKEAEEKTKSALLSITEWLKNFDGAPRSATTSLRVYPLFNQNSGIPERDCKLPKVIGYNASALVSCEIMAEAAGDFTAQASEHGATSVIGLAFHLSDTASTKIEKDLLSEAFDNAKQKAVILCKSAEKKLGEAIRIQAAQNNEANPIHPMMGRSFAAAAPASDESTPYDIKAGESTLNSSVIVDFELLPSSALP